ncbi:hypothetical protein [Nocardioides sp.]|uniref:hypothetical protein n=1 Tax=Nocardioides sp. TaxID=35761 RepID=UPI0035668ED9
MTGCRCGHLSVAHEHYRRGSDCALCDCAKFRAGAALPAVAVETFQPEVVRDPATEPSLAS